MRKVNRNSVSKPSCLDLNDPKSAASVELKEAITYYKTNRKKSFKFCVYRSSDVKLSLEALFHRKCAYCESRYALVQPMDVEHWRPKGGYVGVDGKLVKPGYYWMAAVWDNLLPSCIDCNRVRTHFVNVGSSQEERKLGKGNHYPLKDPSRRAEFNKDWDNKVTESELIDICSSEEPLLLNPCSDDLRCLQFTDEAVIVPSTTDGEERIKVLKSIEVYGLNRLNLVFSRNEVLLLIKNRMWTIERLIDLIFLENCSDSILDRVEDILSHEMKCLQRFCKPDQPYSVMANQMVSKWKSNVLGE